MDISNNIIARFFNAFRIVLYDKMTPCKVVIVYRDGFQEKEKDHRNKGIGNSIIYKHGIYDPGIGKCFAGYPFFIDYTGNSAYPISENIIADHEPIVSEK